MLLSLPYFALPLYNTRYFCAIYSIDTSTRIIQTTFCQINTLSQYDSHFPLAVDTYRGILLRALLFANFCVCSVQRCNQQPEEWSTELFEAYFWKLLRQCVFGAPHGIGVERPRCEVDLVMHEHIIYSWWLTKILMLDNCFFVSYMPKFFMFENAK